MYMFEFSQGIKVDLEEVENLYLDEETFTLILEFYENKIVRLSHKFNTLEDAEQGGRILTVMLNIINSDEYKNEVKNNG